MSSFQSLNYSLSRVLDTSEPSGFSIGEDGTAYVEVHLTARDLHGNALFDAKASHVFQIEDGLIRRFDIRKGRPSSSLRPLRSRFEECRCGLRCCSLQRERQPSA